MDLRHLAHISAELPEAYGRGRDDKAAGLPVPEEYR